MRVNNLIFWFWILICRWSLVLLFLFRVRVNEKWEFLFPKVFVLQWGWIVASKKQHGRLWIRRFNLLLFASLRRKMAATGSCHGQHRRKWDNELRLYTKVSVILYLWCLWWLLIIFFCHLEIGSALKLHGYSLRSQVHLACNRHFSIHLLRVFCWVYACYIISSVWLWTTFSD